jgi:hypothetical protein
MVTENPKNCQEWCLGIQTKIEHNNIMSFEKTVEVEKLSAEDPYLASKNRLNFQATFFWSQRS